MKKILTEIIIVSILFLPAGLCFSQNYPAPDTIPKLRYVIHLLESKILSQAKTIAKLRKEIKRVK